MFVIACILTAILFILKVAGVVAISWLIVLSPVLAALVLQLIIVTLLLGFVAWLSRDDF